MWSSVIIVGTISEQHSGANASRLQPEQEALCQLWARDKPEFAGTVMLIQFLVGGIVSICNITIHALVMTVVVRVARASVSTTNLPSLLLIVTMIATVSVLMGAHVLEVFVWSLAYAIVGAVPAEGSLVYFAFVSYATLGYGDVLPVERWQLLGPMAAMNGALLFGWSTAVIFDVLQRTMAIGSQTAATK